jgi:hypothetical protein
MIHEKKTQENYRVGGFTCNKNNVHLHEPYL